MYRIIPSKGSSPVQPKYSYTTPIPQLATPLGLTKNTGMVIAGLIFAGLTIAAQIYVLIISVGSVSSTSSSFWPSIFGITVSLWGLTNCILTFIVAFQPIFYSQTKIYYIISVISFVIIGIIGEIYCIYKMRTGTGFDGIGYLLLAFMFFIDSALLFISNLFTIYFYDNLTTFALQQGNLQKYLPSYYI